MYFLFVFTWCVFIAETWQRTGKNSLVSVQFEFHFQVVLKAPIVTAECKSIKLNCYWRDIFWRLCAQTGFTVWPKLSVSCLFGFELNAGRSIYLTKKWSDMWLSDLFTLRADLEISYAKGLQKLASKLTKASSSMAKK